LSVPAHTVPFMQDRRWRRNRVLDAATLDDVFG
jgi:hypothetical protein